MRRKCLHKNRQTLMAQNMRAYTLNTYTVKEIKLMSKGRIIH